MAVDTGHVRAADSPADEKARAVEAQMTDEERFSLLYSLMVVVFGGGREPRVPADVPQIAGYVQGIERLGVPALKISDAGWGSPIRLEGGPGTRRRRCRRAWRWRRRSTLRWRGNWVRWSPARCASRGSTSCAAAG